MFAVIVVVPAECFSFIGEKNVGVFHLVGKGRCVVAAAIGHKVHQAELVRPHCCSTTLIYGSSRQEGYAAIFLWPRR